MLTLFFEIVSLKFIKCIRLKMSQFFIRLIFCDFYNLFVVLSLRVVTLIVMVYRGLMVVWRQVGYESKSLPIKKGINTELFIYGMAALFYMLGTYQFKEAPRTIIYLAGIWSDASVDQGSYCSAENKIDTLQQLACLYHLMWSIYLKSKCNELTLEEFMDRTNSLRADKLPLPTCHAPSVSVCHAPNVNLLIVLGRFLIFFAGLPVYALFCDSLFMLRMNACTPSILVCPFTCENKRIVI